jgi:hypothetical protein
MLSTLFYIIYHSALKAPNVNKPFGSEWFSLHLGIVGDEIMNPKIMDSSTPIVTKTEGARAINACMATQSTIFDVGLSVDTFLRTTVFANQAFVITCSTILYTHKVYTNTKSWYKKIWTTSLLSHAGNPWTSIY